MSIARNEHEINQQQSISAARLAEALEKDIGLQDIDTAQPDEIRRQTEARAGNSH